MKTAMRSFIILVLLTLYATSSRATVNIYLNYNSIFDAEFTSGEWQGVDPDDVKDTVSLRVNDDFSSYDINIQYTPGDIEVEIGGEEYGAFGKTVTGVGSYYYHASPYIEIYTKSFSGNSAWQEGNADYERIAEALAATISHELGHAFNMYHAFVYDAYDPAYESGEVKALNGSKWPIEPADLDSTLKATWASASDPLYTRLMASGVDISYEQRATIDRDWSDYTSTTLDFAFNGGGTLSRNFVFGLQDLTYDEHPFNVTSDIVINSGNTFIMPYVVTYEIDENKKIDVYGTLEMNTGTTLTRNGISGLWGYLSIKTTGLLDLSTACTFQYGNGLLVNGSLSFSSNENQAALANILECQGGIWVYDGTPTIRNLRIMDCTTSQALCSTGSSTSVILDHIRIDDVPSYGILLTSGGDLTMSDSEIVSTTSHCINVNSPSSAVSLNDGNNDFYPGANKAINNWSGINIYANNNYWGPNPSGASLFAYPAVVTWNIISPYEAYENAPAARAAVLAHESSPMIDAYRLRKNGDWGSALLAYGDIVRTSSDRLLKKAAIKNIIQINRDNNLSHDEIRAVIDNELADADGWYKATLEYLLAMTDVYDGNYDSAINRLEKIAGRYSGTSMEAEALARIAIILGDCYLDDAAARKYADMAANTNPGQPLLHAAYNSAGEEYKPWDYTDRFAEIIENFDIRPDPETELSETATPSIAITPNPANPATTLHYTIVKPGNVKLAVYNANGQKVATLVDSYIHAGKHSAVFDGANFASGVYFYRLESTGFAKSGKMLLIK